MFLTEEIAKTGNIIDEPTPGTNTKLGFEFIANSQLDNNNRYAIAPNNQYNLNFSLSYGEENTYLDNEIKVKQETFRTDEANRREVDTVFPTDDYAIYRKTDANTNPFDSFTTPAVIGTSSYNWKTDGDFNETTGK